MTIPWEENWEKSYRITIGNHEYKESDYTAQELVAIPTALQRPSLSEETITVPSNARLLSNLVEDGKDRRGFTFRFNSTTKLSQDGGNAENSVLELWNPNDDLIEIINKDPCSIMIEAGYSQKVELEYTGDVVDVKVRNTGADVIYTIKAASGALAMRNTLVNLHYDESISEQDIILDMVGRFPATAVGTYGLDDLSRVHKTGGRNFSGTLISNFDKVMRKHNLGYAHLNGKIVITPYKLKGADYDAFARTNYNLSLDSLKNISDVSKRGDKGTEDSASKLRNIQVGTFYLPVQVGQFITIPDSKYTKQYQGTYQVQAKRTVLDTSSHGWDVVLQCVEVG